MVEETILESLVECCNAEVVREFRKTYLSDLTKALICRKTTLFNSKKAAGVRLSIAYKKFVFCAMRHWKFGYGADGVVIPLAFYECVNESIDLSAIKSSHCFTLHAAFVSWTGFLALGEEQWTS